MGFYCSTEIVDKNNKRIRLINTEKYGIGYGELCFDKEDYVLDIPNRVYYMKTPVKKAKERVTAYYKEIIQKKNQKILDGMKYDKWSEKAIQKIVKFMEELLSCFDGNESEYVYADLSEASYLYKSNDDVKILDKKGKLAFIHHVLDGCYLGMYADDQLQEEVQDFIKSFKEGLLQFDGILSIDNFGTSYDAKFFKLGNQRLVKFEMDIQVSKESIKGEYGVFESVMIPIRPFFLEHGCDYERNYKAEYVLEEGKVRTTIYKLW